VNRTRRFNFALRKELDENIEDAVEQSETYTAKAEIVRRAVEEFLKNNYPNIVGEGRIATS